MISVINKMTSIVCKHDCHPITGRFDRQFNSSYVSSGDSVEISDHYQKQEDRRDYCKAAWEALAGHF